MAKNDIKLDAVKLENAASKLRAMAHPMRIAIIELLSESPRRSVTEIFEHLHIEQATASHHLNILKSKGVLVSEREGKKIYYSLKYQVLKQVVNCLNNCELPND